MGSLAKMGPVGGLASPGPAALMADTLKRYCEPSMSPLTMKDSPMPVGRMGSRVTRVQRLPVVSLRSNQKPVIGVPPSSSGSSQLTVMESMVTPDTVGFSH